MPIDVLSTRLFQFLVMFVNYILITLLKRQTKAYSSRAKRVTILTDSNDISYDDVYSEPLRFYLRDTDALLVVSSSGNSENVVRALRAARDKGVPTVAFTGFKGGRLAEEADTVVHVPVDNYGIVEDLHMSFVHVLTQWMKMRRAA